MYNNSCILIQGPSIPVDEDEEQPANVPFHVSPKFKAILTQLVDVLKTTIPYGRPALLDYFTDEYEKIKIAEALAFCGVNDRFFEITG